MTARDSNIDAYQIMAEILVTVRRIVHRGLEKASGKTWYLDGCPPGLFERLVERKENEVAIDRFDDEYQELITFASLDELAEMIDFNKDLAKLLAAIAPKSTTIADRLREIEALRLKLAATISFDDEDIDNLLEYHQDFREVLDRGIKKPRDTISAPPPPPSPKPEEPPAEDLSTLVAKVEAPPAAEHANDSDEPFAAQCAMASGDDAEVLRVLHREVMSVAEAVYQRDVDRTHPVWEAVRAGGWYDLKKDDMALAPLERFFSVADEARDRQRSGADLDELKAYLHEAEFSKLLLSLREMFMRHKL